MKMTEKIIFLCLVLEERGKKMIRQFKYIKRKEKGRDVKGKLQMRRKNLYFLFLPKLGTKQGKRKIMTSHSFLFISPSPKQSLRRAKHYVTIVVSRVEKDPKMALDICNRR